ncbi:MAG: 7-cyano-7-deazaguanine synthase QueC [Candidatus Omnitrophica bacterium]|nr:7-cyano-7-deazaguanine synthase QueC [Candidatus Omnitrophota bacterium]
MRRAVVLLSGGLDSAVTLFLAKKKGYRCECLIFDYGQRHLREIKAAGDIAHTARCSFKILKIDLPWRGSSLLDKGTKLPSSVRVSKCQSVREIPSTYVPARNIIFLSFALSYAESIRAEAIFIGAHTQDYSGYPDCRPEFYRAYDKVIACGTRAGVEKKPIKVETPLINKNKAQIIRLGRRLDVPFELTWSCYRGGRRQCGRCESCYYRAKGFREAGILDPQKRL